MNAMELELYNQLTGEQQLMFEAIINRETRDHVILEDAMDISSEDARWQYVDEAKFESSVKDAIQFTALSSRIQELDVCITFVDAMGEEESYMVEAFTKECMPKSAMVALRKAIDDFIGIVEHYDGHRNWQGIELKLHVPNNPGNDPYIEHSGILSLENMKAYISTFKKE